MSLVVAIVGFLVLESFNIATLYYKPGSRLGNGLGVFTAFEKSKADPEVHALVRYLVNWVAGTKLIFVFLLIVILATGTEETKRYAVAALIASILSFFWRLYPGIARADREGQVIPKGYSRTLAVMIAGFLAAFIVALGLSLRST